MALNYNINVTGDCLNTSSGVIDLTMSNGTSPYTIQWIDPVFPTNIVVS
jgi:hypothetical protein